MNTRSEIEHSTKRVQNSLSATQRVLTRFGYQAKNSFDATGDTTLARRIALHALVLLGYALVAVALTYPLVFVGSHDIVGTRIAQKDGWQTVWDLWLFRERLVAGENPLWTRAIFWPFGVDMLTYRAYGLSALTLSLPVLLPFGPVAAYKFNIILNFALSGYAMALVARAFVRQWWPALVAGLVYTAGPFHLSRFADGYHDLTAIQWLPLYLFALALWLHGGHWRWGLAAVALLVVNYFTALYYTQFALVWTGVAALVYAFATRRPLPMFARTAFVLGAWALVCTPFLLQNVSVSISYADYLSRQQTHAVDLLDLVLPSAVHPLWGRFDPHSLTHIYGSWNVVPGIGVLLVGVYGLWRGRAQVWPWIVLALVMLLFAMGPRLQVAGVVTPMPLPHQLLNLLSVGRDSQRPNHFLLLTIIVLALGVALALRGRRTRTVFAVGALIVALDCLPPLPWPLIAGPQPAWYTTVGDIAPGGLLHVPYRPREIGYQYDQLWHGRPITGGYVSRVPPNPVAKQPGLALLTGVGDQSIVGGDNATQVQAAFASSCTTGLVAHSGINAKEGPSLKYLREQVTRYLPDARLLHDGDPLVYALPQFAPQPLLVPDDGWHELEDEGDRRWQWTDERATMLLYNPTTKPLPVRLDLAFAAAADAHATRIEQDGQTLWAGAVGTVEMQRGYTLLLAPQQTSTITLTTDGVDDPRGGRTLGLVITRATATALVPTTPADCPTAVAMVPGMQP